MPIASWGGKSLHTPVHKRRHVSVGDGDGLGGFLQAFLEEGDPVHYEKRGQPVTPHHVRHIQLESCLGYVQ